MADNVPISAGTGTTIAADEVTDGTLGSCKVQFIKIMDGTLDGTTKAAVGANGLAVDVKAAVISSGTVTLVSTVTALTGGGVAHDGSAGSVKPHLIGAFASAAAPSDVSADGDATQVWCLRNGSMVANLAVGGTLVTGSAGLPVAQQGTWNITNVSGTVSLPTGAATAAKQPALGTAGTASSDVITVQGVASMTPLLVTASIASAQTLATVTTVGTVTTITNVVHVDDNGASLTVDGTVSANIKPVTSGGLTLYSLLSTGTSGDATNVKASAGQLYWVYVTNTNAAVRYIKFYNSASAPTAGAGTPVLRLAIPGNTAGAGFHIQTAEGLAFSTGIGFTIVTGATDADSTGVAANEVIVNIGYA